MVKKVAIIGAGAMGQGIAQICATAGYYVWVRDIKEEFLEKAKNVIETNLHKSMEKGKMKKEEVNATIKRLHYTLDMGEAVRDAELIIEAIPEDLELKKQVFKDIQKYAKDNAVFATNTSGLSITELGKSIERPEKFIGLHFFNPAPVMNLVEVIRGEKTDDGILKFGVEFVKSLNKVPVVVNKDVPGFIVNRCLVPYLTLAIDDLEKKVATKEEIDATMKYNYGFPMGPIELSDFVGLDVLYMGNKQWGLVKIPEILKKKFEEKEYGLKTLKGFYYWKNGRPKIPKNKAGKYDALRLLAPMINIACELIELGVSNAAEIDKAMKLGTNMPKGPFEFADEIGIDVIKNKLDELYDEKRDDVFKPRKIIKKLIKERELGRKSGKGFYLHNPETYQNINIENVNDEIVKLVLNRPHRLNALTPDLLEELKNALKKYENDENVKVLIITGAGEKAFSVGMDLHFKKESGISNPIESMMLSVKGQEVLTAIEKFPKPVIAAINGYAFGGGCELALACDFRIMSKNTQIGLPELDLGLIPGWGGTQRMVKIVGVAKAKELILLSRRISGEEAEKIGLIHKAVEPEKFWDEVIGLAKRLASGAPLAQKIAKMAINLGIDLPVEVGQTIEAAFFGIVDSTKDAEEGLNAFMRKEKPKFKGK